MGFHDMAKKGIRNRRQDRKRDRSQERPARRRSQERRRPEAIRSYSKEKMRSQEKRSRSKERRRSRSQERKADCIFWLEGICRFENNCRNGVHNHRKKGIRSRRQVVGQQQVVEQQQVVGAQQQYFGQPQADTFLSQGSANRVNEIRNPFIPMQTGQPMMMMVPAGHQVMQMPHGPAGHFAPSRQ